MSTLKSKYVQLGQDATSTNNFTLYQPAVPDGTLRLGAGNQGAATDKFSFTNTGLLYTTNGITYPDQNGFLLSVAGSATGHSNWGLYYDTSGSTVVNASLFSSYFPGDNNVIGFIGSGVPRWSVSLNSGAEYNWLQRCTYDRAWDGYPSISVHNDTTNGPVGDFRIHGIGGSSGGDYSVNTRSDGGFTSGSDRRKKSNIETIQNALDKVCQLRGTTFNLISSDGNIDPYNPGKKFGFIAQEAVGIIPEVVKYYEEEDKPNDIGWANAYALDYGSLTPLLVEAIKELNTKLEAAEAKIAALEGK